MNDGLARFERYTTQKEPALTASFLAAVLLAIAARYLSLTDEDLAILGPVVLIVCLTHGTEDNPLTGDHLVPRSMGGTERDGIVVRCRSCSAKRGTTCRPRATASRGGQPARQRAAGS